MRCFLCCDESLQDPEEIAFQVLQCNCANCDRYRIDASARGILSGNDALAFKVACYIFSLRAAGTVNVGVDYKLVERVKDLPPPTVAERVELYLKFAIGTRPNELFFAIDPSCVRLRLASWSYYQTDARALSQIYVDKGDFSLDQGRVTVTPQAHMAWDKIRTYRTTSGQAFVAMSFNRDMNEAFDAGIRVAIEGAGYTAYRVDRAEHIDRIDDQIIAEIRRSAFVVADFTGHRGGVYYEAGFAHGLGKKVIFTCRQDDLNSLHFDVRQYNTLVWAHTGELHAPLRNRILAALGAGPNDPNAAPLPVLPASSA